MKKMTLLILSGIIILSLSLPAAAQGANFYTEDGSAKAPNPVYVAPGTSKTLSFGINGVGADEYQLPVTIHYPIKAGTGNEVEITNVQAFNGGNVGDITVTAVSNSFTINQLSDMKPDSGGNYYFVDKGNLLISVADGADPDASYYFAIRVTGTDSSLPPIGISVEANQKTTSIPEFPTVAAPIAGIIGLLFVFGRKKEGL